MLKQIYKDYKYELNPNNKQRTHLSQHAGMARYAWNWALERIKNKMSKPNAITLHKEWNIWKRTNAPWWTETSKCAPQAAFQNLEKAFKAFFNKISQCPRFKAKKRSKLSFRLCGVIHLNGRYVTLPRLGIIKLKEKSEVTGRILAATITEQASRWFVSIRVETQIEVTENQGLPIGVDLGCKNLATLSDGRTITGPKAHKQAITLLQRVNRQYARTEPGSKRRERVRRRLANIHYRISNIRKDCLHKLTSVLARTCGVIGIEDLNVSGMVRNRSLARSVSDMGFGEFRRQLEYKTSWYGSKLVVHDRFFPSSKCCSSCWLVKESLSLSERVFSCGCCGLVIDRDLNAAVNLRPVVRRVLDVEAVALASESITSETVAREASTKHSLLSNTGG